MLIYVHQLGWSALTPGKEELMSAHSLPLGFLEPALCKGRYSEHLIPHVLLSFSVQKERKSPSLPAHLGQCQQPSPAQSRMPLPQDATSGLGYWTAMFIYVPKVIKTHFYHTQQCIISIFFNLCFSLGELCALKSAMPFFFPPSYHGKRFPAAISYSHFHISF